MLMCWFQMKPEVLGFYRLVSLEAAAPNPTSETRTSCSVSLQHRRTRLWVSRHGRGVGRPLGDESTCLLGVSPGRDLPFWRQGHFLCDKDRGPLEERPRAPVTVPSLAASQNEDYRKPHGGHRERPGSQTDMLPNRCQMWSYRGSDRRRWLSACRDQGSFLEKTLSQWMRERVLPGLGGRNVSRENRASPGAPGIPCTSDSTYSNVSPSPLYPELGPRLTLHPASRLETSGAEVPPCFCRLVCKLPNTTGLPLSSTHPQASHAAPLS